MTVKLTLAEVAAGRQEDGASSRRLDRCATCEGSGAKPGTKPTHLHHLRRQRRGAPRGAQHVRAVRLGVALSHLRGRGRGHPRAVRGLPRRGPGAGRADRHGGDPGRRLRQQLPDAARARARPGPRNGPAGDLLVMLDIKDDDRFERQGDDLVFDLPLSFSQAALGGEFTVPTPYGDEQITHPAGHAAGDDAPPARARACRVLGQSGKGDLHRAGARLDAGAAHRRAGAAVPASWPSSRASRPSARPGSGPSSRKRSAHELVGHRRAAGPVAPRVGGRVAGGADGAGGRGAGRRHAGHLRRGRARGRRAGGGARGRGRLAGRCHAASPRVGRLDVRWREGSCPFDHRNYGYSKFSDLVEGTGLFEMKRVEKTLLVRDARAR